MEILDPTISPERDRIDYAPRPKSLKGLRIGLVENSKRNSEKVLRKIADRLREAHGMTIAEVVHKPQRAPLEEKRIAELKSKADFVISGVGA